MLLIRVILLVACCVVVTEAGKMPLGFRSVMGSASSSAPASPTTPGGCEYAGKVYPRGSQFGDGYDPHSNWCFGYFCSNEGELIAWDNLNCKTTITTTTPTPSTPPEACFYNGKYFQPNSDIDSGYDESSDWCYGAFCNENAEVIQWDKFNCKASSTTSPATTAAASTTQGSSVSAGAAKLLEKLRKFLKLYTSKLFV